MRRMTVVHPFLFAAFPVVSLFSANVDDVAVGDAVFCTLVALAGVAILWLMFWLMLRDARKRGLALSITVLLCFAYGPAMDALRTISGQNRLLRDISSSWVLCGGIAVAALGWILLRRTHHTFEKTTVFLNRVAAIALLVALATALLQMGRHQYYTAHTHAVRPAQSSRPAPAPHSPAPPNIYYVILDAYARADILRDVFHYDNSAFLGALRQRGFFVANKSHSNYMYTSLSLSSALNLDYLVPSGEGANDDAAFRTQILNQTRANKVAAFLKEQGYTYVTFATSFDALRQTGADVIEKPRVVLTEFQNLLITKTPLRTLLSRMPNPWQYFAHRNLIRYVLDRLPELSAYGAPLFVFALVPAPHAPFVFDADGRAVYPALPFSMLDGNNLIAYGMTPESYRAGYTGQLAYISKRVLNIVDRILAASPNTIIILQGDHGSRMGLTDDPTTTNLHEVFGNLTALYLPDRDPAAIFYDDISPVNSFRILFNAYFGTHYDRLPDKSFFSPWSLNSMIDVTEKIVK